MELRNFKVCDIARVRDMFCEAFELGCYSKNRFVMRHILDHYLCCYLAGTDMAIAAEDDDGIAGFLLGCTQKRNGRAIYRLLKLYHSMFLPFSHGGRAYIRCKRLIEDADMSMRAEAPVPESELQLFVVRADKRGSGIGRKMLTEFKILLMKNGVQNMQLFTDDYCDVEYYRIRGYEQLGARHIEFAPGIDSMFYLFSTTVDKIGRRSV